MCQQERSWGSPSFYKNIKKLANTLSFTSRIKNYQEPITRLQINSDYKFSNTQTKERKELYFSSMFDYCLLSGYWNLVIGYSKSLFLYLPSIFLYLLMLDPLKFSRFHLSLTKFLTLDTINLESR